MATVTKTIKPAGGGDYTSLVAACIGESSNAGNDVVFECYAGDLGAFTIDDTFLANSITIRAHASERHNGTLPANPSNYALLSDVCNVARGGVTLEGMVVGVAIVTAGNIYSFVGDSLLFIEGAAIQLGYDEEGQNSTLKNCVFYAGGLVYIVSDDSHGGICTATVVIDHCVIPSMDVQANGSIGGSFAVTNDVTITNSFIGTIIASAHDMGVNNITADYSGCEDTTLATLGGNTHGYVATFTHEFSSASDYIAYKTGATRNSAGTVTTTLTDINGAAYGTSPNIGASSLKPPYLATINVSPSSATVAPGGTVTLTATALDQYGIALDQQPEIIWSVESDTTGGASVTGGVVTLGETAGGDATISAANGAVSGEATVTVEVGKAISGIAPFSTTGATSFTTAQPTAFPTAG